ncbi:MAG: hypothetical protein QF569_01555 [Candidatus Poribacteria bacterium]|nr:hypothetical protein [Candidatus Poribacteria bacterium]
MLRNHFFRLFLIATTIVLSSIGRADNHINPDGRGKMAKIGQERLNNYIMQRLDYLLEQVGQSLGQRYNLDQTIIDKLKRSIVESIETQLKQEKIGNVRSFAGAARKGGMEMLEIVLSQPGCKAALAKYLNEKQLQDYLDFTRARGQRDQQAVNRHLTAVWDQQFSLTADQRRQIEQLLGAETGAQWRLTSMDMLYGSEESVNMAYHKLKVSMDEVLSESQSNIWRLLKNRRKAKIDEVEIRENRLAEAEKKIIEAVKAGKITRREAGKEIEAMKEEFWTRDKDDNRLNDDDWDEDEDPRKEEFQRAEKRIRIAVEVGRITKQQAEKRLAEMKLRADGAANRKMEFDPETQKDQKSGFKDVLTNHPLYQKTISDVLPIEAYAEYQRKQEKKKAYYMMANRDLVVAMFDTTLLLSEKQRQQIETVIEDLQSSYDFGPDINRQLFARLMTEKNSVNLSQWQQDRVGEYNEMNEDDNWDKE